MAYNKPDFKRAYILANEILAASNMLCKFPVNTKAIVKEWSDISIHKYEFAVECGIDIEAFGSKAAVLQCKSGRYILFYNSNDSAPRIRFSILHEFGHYRFGHELKNYANQEEYGRIEIEANCFAAQILMPEQVLNELKKRGAYINVDFLMNYFGVSELAAKKRIETMGKVNYEWRSEEEQMFDETILYKYKDFIDAILPKKNSVFSLDREYDMQQERDSWDLDKRYRYR
jgi:hypothetical protein